MSERRFGTGRLPRTNFVEDPFMYDHQADFDNARTFPRPEFTDERFQRPEFNDDRFQRPESNDERFQRPNIRHFGSSNGLNFDDFFHDDFGSRPFGSLPRRPPARSPQMPRKDQQQQPNPQNGSASPPQQPQQPMGQERVIPVNISTSPSNRGPSPNPRQQPQQQQQQQEQPKKPSPRGAVEINNATSNYSNGQLNPDRANIIYPKDSPNVTNIGVAHEPRIRVESVKTTHAPPPPTFVPKPPSPPVQSEIHPSQVPIPMPPPAQVPETASISSESSEPGQVLPESQPGPQPPSPKVSKNRRVAFASEKKTSIDAGAAEQLVNILDEAERQVEELREIAARLESEKESILETLANVRLNADIFRLGSSDREDIEATAERILKRCKAVEVAVSTPRNPEQAQALAEVNKLIDGVINKMKDNLTASKETVEMYMNACCPEDNGPVDQKFQSRIIECTADDQKKIRRRLAHLVEQIQRTEMIVYPEA